MLGSLPGGEGAALRRHRARRDQHVHHQVDHQRRSEKLNMMVVMTMWLPRYACSHAGTAAQATAEQGGRRDRHRDHQATPAAGDRGARMARPQPSRR